MRTDKYKPTAIDNIIIKKLLKCGFLTLALFLILSWLVVSGYTVVVDNFVSNFIYPLRTQWANTLFINFTSLMNWEMVTAYCILLLLFYRTRKNWGFRLTIYIIATTLIQQGLKRFYQRPRPDSAFHLIKETSFSFPSGHSITAMVFLGYVFAVLLISLWKSGKNLCITPKKLWKTGLSLWKKLLIICLPFWILAIGFSRIYLGVHYLTDVVGAWLLGTFLVCMFLCLDLSCPTKNAPIVVISKRLQNTYRYKTGEIKENPQKRIRDRKTESIMDKAMNWKTMKIKVPSNQKDKNDTVDK